MTRSKEATAADVMQLTCVRCPEKAHVLESRPVPGLRPQYICGTCSTAERIRKFLRGIVAEHVRLVGRLRPK